QCAQVEDWQKAKSIYEFMAKDIDGNEVSLEKYRGYACIITNVLTQLHATYAEKGLRILGFPCNQFGKQEPGTEEEIKEFAKSYGAEFDLFSKIDVNGPHAHPLWKWMKEQPKGKGTLGNNIKWNFTKFLIDREGKVVKRYSPMDDPVVIINKNIPHYSYIQKTCILGKKISVCLKYRMSSYFWAVLSLHVI
uniref:phospholipid-hydroperoxide glutathione peroxidase n=1 Tax=Erpetoichthys calabaricus TaxID=27687 RepID=A0A8C4SU45_ERPCA